MITNADMAQVLEDAADMYLAEKVHWCQESYLKRDEAPILTVCATTALGMAAGLGALMPLAADLTEHHVPRRSQAVLLDALEQGWGRTHMIDPRHVTWSRRAQALYFAAKKQVEKKLRAREFYHLPAFNDDDDTTMDQVVDLFQSVAKDLRNKEEAR